MQKALRGMIGTLRPNSSRTYLYDFVNQAAQSLPPNASVLDAGAGDNPYKHLFKHVHYDATDFWKVEKDYGEATYICDLAAIPIVKNRYDAVLLTQVLEHMPEPLRVLAELHRVLRPGGKLWLSAPLFFPEHEVPFDFYRYTQYGFTYLLEKAGFSVDHITWLEGYYGTLSYQLLTAAKALPLQPMHYGGGLPGVLGSTVSAFSKPLFLGLSICFSHLDIRKKYTATGHCKNYAIVATKN